MTQARQRLVDQLWGGRDPFGGPAMRSTDYQGWASDNPLLARAIDEVRPSIVLEIGVWKDGSVITMAERMRELSLDGAVIAVDTWLGSSEHWIASDWKASLGFENGYPTLYRTFEANVLGKGLGEFVVPLPLDATSAAQVIQHFGIELDVLHIDGAHDYASVVRDLTSWWPLLRSGGIIIGDDYYPNTEMWPEVCRAFNDFFSTSIIENYGGKCWLKK